MNLNEGWLGFPSYWPVTIFLPKYPVSFWKLWDAVWGAISFISCF